MSNRRTSAIVAVSSSSPSGIAAHAGWYGSRRWYRPTSSASPAPIIAPASSTGHQASSPSAIAHAARKGSSAAASRDSIRPLSVYDIS